MINCRLPFAPFTLPFAFELSGGGGCIVALVVAPLKLIAAAALASSLVQCLTRGLLVWFGLVRSRDDDDDDYYCSISIMCR